MQHPLHVVVLMTFGVHSWPPACSARRQAVIETHGTTSAGRRAFAERTGRRRGWFFWARVHLDSADAAQENILGANV